MRPQFLLRDPCSSHMETFVTGASHHGEVASPPYHDGLRAPLASNSPVIEIRDLIEQLSSDDTPHELRLVFFENAFPEIVNNKDPLCGVDVIELSRCRKFGLRNFYCTCYACDARRKSHVRNFIRSPIMRSPILYRAGMRLYKAKVNFVYYTETERVYGSADCLDAFMSSFGAVSIVGGGSCISHLTVVYPWKCEFGLHLSQTTRDHRGSLPPFFGLDHSDIDTFINLAADTSFVVRILSALRHYKASLELTFANTPSNRRSFIEKLCTLRKQLIPRAKYENKVVKWWDFPSGNPSYWDMTLDSILDDHAARSSFVQALQEEEQFRQEHEAKWQLIDPDLEPAIDVGHLTIKVDFSDAPV